MMTSGFILRVSRGGCYELSELEDPVTTLLRLINTRIRVTKDNGSLAKILASEAALDRELLLKEYDAQITLFIDPILAVQDKKLNLAGSLRQQIYIFGCSVHTIDKPTVPGSDLGKVMRNKVTAQLKAVIRENRTLPYQTAYNFVGLGYPSGDPHKALSAAAASELAPSSASWAELSALEYQSVWYSDDVWYSKSAMVNDQYASMLFKFKIGSRAQCVKKLVLAFEGYGTAPAGNGVTVKLWNHTLAAWQQTQTGNGSEDETLTITISAGWTDFMDSQGYVYFLARTTNPSNGVTPAVLFCDYAQISVQVLGITFCDVVSYKPIDITDVKPFLFKEELVLKGWSFEFISGVF
jgi:hypothetical protein